MELVLPEVGLEQLAEIQGVVHVPGLETRVDSFSPVAAAVGALVEMIGVQAAVPAEHGEDALLVLARELAVESVGVHRLGEQLGDVPAGVGHDPAARDGLAVETVPVVEEGRAVVVGEDLQLDPEFLAVAEDRAMVVGDAGRPHVRVQVIPAAELHPLPAVGFLQHVTPAGGEAAPPGAAGGFEDGAVVSGLRQLPGGGHARDAGPQDRDALPPARIGRKVRRGRCRVCRADAREPQRFHGAVDGACPGRRTDGLQESAFRHGRVHHVLSCRVVGDEGELPPPAAPPALAPAARPVRRLPDPPPRLFFHHFKARVDPRAPIDRPPVSPAFFAGGPASPAGGR